VEDLVVAAEAAVEDLGEDVEAVVTGILGAVTTVVDGEVCILVGLTSNLTLARNIAGIICLCSGVSRNL
jgi:hypothetical protein